MLAVSSVLLFQSTLPMKGATVAKYPNNKYWKFQSTLPMKGATPPPNSNKLGTLVSIHAPNEGSDVMLCCIYIAMVWFQSTLPMKGATIGRHKGIINPMFQSTLPMKGATKVTPVFLERKQVSIHAPNEGSDL